MATELTFFVNTDTQDQPKGSSGVEWTGVDLLNDKLIFSKGSDVVKDGESIPTSQQLSQAGSIIEVDEDVIVKKYFLADEGSNLLREIHLAGNQNKRYVFCFSFDGITASEPILELWDDESMDSINIYSLGEGSAIDSWWRGKVTTDGLPGANWVGSKLAGSSDGHFLWLNNQNGALAVAKNLYCNLKIVIPMAFEHSGSETPLFCVKFTTN